MRSKGFAYETQAEQYLIKQGYLSRERNFHTRRGEIDLIMSHDQTLVFIEVRFRKSAKFGTAEESITKAKQRRIITSAKEYINKHKLWHMNIQFDVVTLTPSTTNEAITLNWLKHAFSAN